MPFGPTHIRPACTAAVGALFAVLMGLPPNPVTAQPGTGATLTAESMETAPESAVKAVQKALRKAGHDPGRIDGAWGKSSVEALKAFQRTQDISPTGEVGAKTAQALGLSTDPDAKPDPTARRSPATKTATKTGAAASGSGDCPVSHQQLAETLRSSVAASGGPDNGGLPFNEWAAVVDRTGTVCAVVFSGEEPTDQWLGSRAIALEKANTVISFSLDKFAVSTANLWAQSQPGGYLYGANISNPPRAKAIYAGKVSEYGSPSDPIIGQKAGGVIVFGGGVPLYRDGRLVGGLGASGNTACADHNIAWRVRSELELGDVPAGPSPENDDRIVYDIGTNGKSETGWGHPECGRSAPQVAQRIGAGIVMQPTQAAGATDDRQVPKSTPLERPTPLDVTPPRKED